MRFPARWLMLAVLMAAPAAALGGVFVSINIAPPELPVYVQPPVPAPGYLWTPGYWSYGDEGYFWVPGTWVAAPFRGALWTPGYWGWVDGLYVWNRGYWGLHVGYYGGIPYGFGYTGVGFAGGAWREGHFAYNETVTHVDRTIITHTYSEHVVEAPRSGRISYNGGTGGIAAQPTEEERRVMAGKHSPPLASQVQHERAARSDESLRASVNHGQPAVAAVARPVSTATQFHAPPSAGGRGGGATTAGNSRPAGTPGATAGNSRSAGTPGATAGNPRPAGTPGATAGNPRPAGTPGAAAGNPRPAGTPGAAPNRRSPQGNPSAPPGAARPPTPGSPAPGRGSPPPAAAHAGAPQSHPQPHAPPAPAPAPKGRPEPKGKPEPH